MSKVTAGGRITRTTTPSVDEADANAQKPGKLPAADSDLVEVSVSRDFKARQVLTLRQRKVLQTIEWFRQCRGYAPTLREIGAAVGLASASSVAYHLSCLQDMGYLSRDEGRPRTAVIRASDLRDSAVSR